MSEMLVAFQLVEGVNRFLHALSHLFGMPVVFQLVEEANHCLHALSQVFARVLGAVSRYLGHALDVEATFLHQLPDFGVKRIACGQMATFSVKTDRRMVLHRHVWWCCWQKMSLMP